MSERPDLDCCECGDFRRDHENGTGKCIFDHHGGAADCQKFRFNNHTDPKEFANYPPIQAN